MSIMPSMTRKPSRRLTFGGRETSGPGSAYTVLNLQPEGRAVAFFHSRMSAQFSL
jgi:hypothetical protein